MSKRIPRRGETLLFLIDQSTILFFILLIVFFSLAHPAFLSIENFKNILIQTSSIGIIAVGMTFVLLTAGIDLSVGSIMFLAGVVSGKMVVGGSPIWAACIVILLMGVLYGAINAFFITRLNILPFIVTLATLFIGRGFGLYLSETRAVNLPAEFTSIGSSTVSGIPFPVWIMVLVFIISHYILSSTSLGRQIYAVGNHREKAEKAGLHTRKILFFCYVFCGLLAALGGLVSIAQLGAISPSFGNQREFAAIAAAVLGGASLFGGKGHVLPGTFLGALLIQTLECGLTILNTDPYLYPLITGAIIFLVVLNDSIRQMLLKKYHRRAIRLET